MATPTTVTLIPTTSFGTAVGNYDGSSSSFTSDKVKGDGYYGFVDGVHTVFWQVTNFVGVIKLQGTLAQTPTSSDWFDIDLKSNDGNYTITADGLVSESVATSVTYSSATSESKAYNFVGNIVWIRASICSFTAGTVNTIQMAH